MNGRFTAVLSQVMHFFEATCAAKFWDGLTLELDQEFSPTAATRNLSDFESPRIIEVTPGMMSGYLILKL